MAKTLVIAEKPSVARDLASTLPGSFKQSKDKTHLETQDGSSNGGGYVVTWAVGHLVGLAPPDEYDPKLKKWRFADLPILEGIDHAVLQRHPLDPLVRLD